MDDWNSLVEWLAPHGDLELGEALEALGEDQRAAILSIFQRYANLAAPPKTRRMLDIIGEETNQFILLASKGMPAVDWPRRRVISINFTLALLRFVLLNTPDPSRPDLAEYISTMEQPMMRPMLEQGVDQAYPLLKQSGLVH